MARSHLHLFLSIVVHLLCAAQLPVQATLGQVYLGPVAVCAGPPIAPGGMQYRLTASPQVKAPSAAAHPQPAFNFQYLTLRGRWQTAMRFLLVRVGARPRTRPTHSRGCTDCMKRDLFSAVFDQAAANKPPLSLLVRLAFQT